MSTTTDYAHWLRVMRNPNNPLHLRIQAAKDASDYEDKVAKLAHESGIQYLHPKQNEAKIAHNARIAYVARKWLALLKSNPKQIPEVPPLPKQIITVEGGLPPLPGTNVIMPILP
jgi:hypothetical protein